MAHGNSFMMKLMVETMIPMSQATMEMDLTDSIFPMELARVGR